MKIDIKWEKPYRLSDGAQWNMIYRCNSIAKIPNKVGVYVFARIYDGEVEPLYVGQALKVRKRIEQQFNNVQLMMGIKQARSGNRIVLVGRISLHPGQSKEKVLNIVESALIKHALSAGHDLLNQQGTRTKVHSVHSKGNTSSRQIAPLEMLVGK